MDAYEKLLLWLDDSSLCFRHARAFHRRLKLFRKCQLLFLQKLCRRSLVLNIVGISRHFYCLQRGNLRSCFVSNAPSRVNCVVTCPFEYSLHEFAYFVFAIVILLSVSDHVSNRFCSDLSLLHDMSSTTISISISILAFLKFSKFVSSTEVLFAFNHFLSENSYPLLYYYISPIYVSCPHAKFTPVRCDTV